MFVRQIINLTKCVSSLRQPATLNKQRTLWNVGGLTKFYSSDQKDKPSLQTGDDEDRKLKLIKLELESLREEGRDVPDIDFLKPQHWTESLKLGSRNARGKYYYFLHTTQKKKETEKVKKQQKSLAYASFKEQQAKEDQAPRKPRFLLRIYPQTINKWRNHRLFRAMQFSEKIIFDCSYDQYMNRKEAKSAAEQLVRAFSENRRNRDPFDLHFCNVNFNGPTFERVLSEMPTLRDKTFPLNLHEGSYLDVFPKDKLVYLTPHCKTDLKDYDPDAIYIIGAMVDTTNHEPLSMSKAKELGIKMARLPLDRYLDWKLGDKTLTLDQMMKIMMEWRATNNWDKALQHVPRRKVMNKDVGKQKEVRKWNVYAGKFKTNNENKNNSFEYDSDSTGHDLSGLSTAEKFQRKPGTIYQLPNRFERSTKTNLRTDGRTEVKQGTGKSNQLSHKFEKSSRLDSSRTDGNADKVKKPNRTSSKSRVVDIKKLLDE